MNWLHLLACKLTGRKILTYGEVFKTHKPKEAWTDGNKALHHASGTNQLVELANEQYRKAFGREREQAKAEVSACEQERARTKKGFSLWGNTPR